LTNSKVLCDNDDTINYKSVLHQGKGNVMNTENDTIRVSIRNNTLTDGRATYDVIIADDLCNQIEIAAYDYQAAVRMMQDIERTLQRNRCVYNRCVYNRCVYN
jgi:hypothetical protein